jgi:predicted Zn finger-like uncharacterized protein
MIINCESCSRKFVVKDSDIPEKGRTVQCGYCSVTWHQLPILVPTQTTKPINPNINEGLSVENIKASDGKTYKFLGSQWAQLLPSGKTGLFAKKKIGRELDKLTGRKVKNISSKKVKKELNPSSGNLNNEKQLPEIYKDKEGLGFFGYIFLIIITGFSIIGILKTFENDLVNFYPELELVYEIINQQLIYVAETVKNIIVIVKDLLDSY